MCQSALLLVFILGLVHFEPWDQSFDLYILIIESVVSLFYYGVNALDEWKWNVPSLGCPVLVHNYWENW